MTRRDDPAASLAGALWLRPGAPRPHNLRSTRPDWVRRITQDLPVARLPATLGHLFSLCGHAHVLCAGLALDAAQGREPEVSAAMRARLATQTLREHLRRLWLDWPRLLGAVGADDAADRVEAGALANCPVFVREPGPARDWLATQVLGMAPEAWLRAWQADAAGWLDTWSDGCERRPARALRAGRVAAREPLPSLTPLRPHADAGALRRWAQGLRAGGHRLAREPHWHGDCVDTGAWTRLHESAPARLHSAWLRLGARLAEVLRLALPDAPAHGGTGWLHLGALPLAEGEGIAWVEMSRGLLMHHVQLDGCGDAARVAACHVIAPTEWNFHPQGAVAQWLESQPTMLDAAARRRLDAVLAAYDACVPCEIDTPTTREAAHA